MIAGRLLERQGHPFSAPRRDIGLRCAVRQSSAASPGAQAAALYPSGLRGGCFFQTTFEDRPWIVVDLGRLRVVGEVVLWNRDAAGSDVAARALPLRVCVSLDGETWQAVANHTQPFGGRRDGQPLAFAFPNGVRARFLRVQALRRTSLHLDYIEIVQFVPPLTWGTAVAWRHDAAGELGCDYLHQTNHGLFSNVTTALQDLLALSRALIEVHRIDFTASFRHFKDAAERDLYPVLFEPPPPAALAPRLLALGQGLDFRGQDVHKPFHTLKLRELRELAALLFTPSAAVRALEAGMLARAGVTPERALGVVYRGTDKSTEVVVPPIEAFIAAARPVLAAEPGLQLLIQTDQAQAREAMIAAFPDRVRWFDELPVTQGATVMHNLSFGEEVAMTREAFGCRLLAAVHALSRCRHLVLGSSNVSTWVAIYRGHVARLRQFGEDGRLVAPPAEEPVATAA